MTQRCLVGIVISRLPERSQSISQIRRLVLAAERWTEPTLPPADLNVKTLFSIEFTSPVRFRENARAWPGHRLWCRRNPTSRITEKGDFIPTLGGTFTTHVLTGITGHGWVPVPPRADRFEIRDETLSVPLLFTSISEVTPVPG